MNKLKTIIMSAVLAVGAFGFVAAQTAPAFAAIDPQQQICAGSGGTGGAGGCSGQTTGANDLTKVVKNIVNTLLFILGIVAVIVIIIGGLRYITSNGDASKVKSAKDTILYAIIGLIIAILAYAIVNFVIATVK